MVPGRSEQRRQRNPESSESSASLLWRAVGTTWRADSEGGKRRKEIRWAVGSRLERRGGCPYLRSAGGVAQPQFLPGSVRYGAGAPRRGTHCAAPAAVPLGPRGPAGRAGAPISGAGNLRTADSGGVVVRAVVAAAPSFVSLEVQPLADPVEESRHAHGLDFTLTRYEKINT